MAHVQVLTLFPELFERFTSAGLMSRAIESGAVRLTTHHLRQFAINTHGQVDDSPYGGGSGMVLRPESSVRAIRHAKELDPTARVILLTPRGAPLRQRKLRDLASHLQDGKGLVFLCCRYEGIDERVAANYVDDEISLGDFVLMGGEVPAMAVIEGVARLLPGVLGNPASTVHESFETVLLEAPQYTKPQEFEGHIVPEVLLSGNHQRIEAWRKEQAYEATLRRRPDLISGPVTPRGEFSVALIHHPVVDKQGMIITSSITNIDLHDIARSSTTFGIKHFYATHPAKVMRRLAGNLSDHWSSGFGLQYNPNRSEALETLRIVSELDDVIMDVEARCGVLPKLIVTSAIRSDSPKSVTFDEMRQKLLLDPAPHIMLLGTGWGLAKEVCDRADYRLEPIVGPTPYNHLSVRAAAAIMLGRLLG